jgi:hypothetical protein
MKKEFIPYEQALALKQLGFDEPNHFLKWYDSKGGIREGLGLGEVMAPLYQQACRWFRKNHGLYSSILPKKSYPDNYVSGVEWYVTICGGDGVEIGPDGTYTYEEAELACLNKLIEIVGTIELPQHPPVFSENGNELLFDKEGKLIKENQKEISDEEIEKSAKEWYEKEGMVHYNAEIKAWVSACKWYREQLKTK